MEDTKRASFNVTTVLSILTLILSIIAIIPSFLALNKNFPKIFYSTNNYGILIPEGIKKNEVKKILSENKIPISTFEMKLINKGNYESKNVKISIALSEKFSTFSTIPPIKEQNVWLTIKDIKVLNDSKKILIFLENFAVNKIFGVQVGFDKEDLEPIKAIDIIYDGKLGNEVDDVNLASDWSALEVFKLPLYIFIGGLVLTVFSAFIFVLKNNEKLRKNFIEIFSITLGMIFPLSYEFLSDLKKNKSDKKGEK